MRAAWRRETRDTWDLKASKAMPEENGRLTEFLAILVIMHADPSVTARSGNEPRSIRGESDADDFVRHRGGLHQPVRSGGVEEVDLLARGDAKDRPPLSCGAVPVRGPVAKMAITAATVGDLVQDGRRVHGGSTASSVNLA